MSTNLLFQAVQKRPRPEDVAELILEVVPGLPKQARNILDRAAANSLKRSTYRYSSMASDFRRPDGAAKQVRVGADLFNVAPLSAEECLDSVLVHNFMARVTVQIRRPEGAVDFKADRLNRDDRVRMGAPKGHRAYNKRFRFLARLESKIERMVRNDTKFGHTQMAKSGFATRLTEADLARDPATAAFVAYLTARMNLRSQFTDTSQIRAYDDVADALYRFAVNGTPNWWAMAHVHPEREVLEHLTEEEKGKLLSMSYDSLLGIANFLEREATKNNIDLDKMVVRRGQDSSTWNATAGAWNKARSAWMDLLYAMGAEEILDQVCPGKVLRLMAADVVRWHTAIHPDTHVWKILPAPWDVLRGYETCTRKMVEAACERYSVKVAGWCAPRPTKRPVPFTVTPELVHGVAVSSPNLANLLRKVGVFSGKALRGMTPENLTVHRTESGAAVFASEGNE